VPKFKAGGLPALNARSFASWIRRNPCPETGTSTRAVHRWICSAGLTAHKMGVEYWTAHDMIEADVVANSGRRPHRREIVDTLDRIYNAAPPRLTGNEVGSARTRMRSTIWKCLSNGGTGLPVAGM
jgi:hypothetical protein